VPLQSTATAPVVSTGFPGGVRAIIRAVRTALPGPDLSPQPVRAFVARACTAEVKHARNDFWTIVHRLNAASMFDRHRDPDCDVAFRLPHEIHAAAALNWLAHLQTHDSDRHGLWARWEQWDRERRVCWLRRRRELLHGPAAAGPALPRGAPTDRPAHEGGRVMTTPTRTPGRRSFLAAFTGAVAAPAGLALPAAAASQSTAESPELLALGERLQGEVAAYRAAVARKAEAFAEYERLRPAIPAEILAEHEGNLATMEKGPDGVPIGGGPRECSGFFFLYRSNLVKAELIRREIPTNTKEGRRWRKVARIAKKYERDKANALRASGYVEARNMVSAIPLQDLAKEIGKIKPTTLQGLTVYAAAFLAGRDVWARELNAFEAAGVTIAEAAWTLAAKCR
jgi:hypothetical protein